MKRRCARSKQTPCGHCGGLRIRPSPRLNLGALRVGALTTVLPRECFVSHRNAIVNLVVRADVTNITVRSAAWDRPVAGARLWSDTKSVRAPARRRRLRHILVTLLVS